MDLSRILEDNYEKFLRLAKRKISTSAISNISWLRINGAEEIEEIYIFKGNGSLMVSRNDSVQKCQYEYIVDSDSLIIEYEDDKAILFQSALIDKRFLILRKSSSNEFLAFANSTIFKDQLKRQIQRQFKNEMGIKDQNLKKSIQEPTLSPKAKAPKKEIEEYPYNFSKLFWYKGKLSRLQFFSCLILVTIASFTILLFFSGIAETLLLIEDSVNSPIVLLFSIIFGIVFYTLIIFQMIKRLNDLKLNGYYALLIFVPIVNLFLIFYLFFTPGRE